MTFLDRLKSLWPENASPADFYNKINMSASGFMRIWKHGTIPSAEYLVKIKEITGCSLDWLITGNGEPFPKDSSCESEVREQQADDALGRPVDLDSFVFLPFYDIYASAGHGYPIDDISIDTEAFCLAFRKTFIERNMLTDIKNLSVITVKGDSMEGVLNHGDIILVNHAKTEPINGLYVIRIGNDLFVKNVSREKDKLILASANPIYRPFEIDLKDDTLDISVVGKVEWYGRFIG